MGFVHLTRTLAILLLLVGFGGLARAQVPDPNAYDETAAGDAGNFFLNMRGMLARQQAGALWRRLSPLRRGLLSPDSPWLAGNGAGRASPVSGEAGGPQGWGVWMEGAPARMRNLSAALRGRGYTLSQTLGLDRQLAEHTILGISINYSYTRARTLYNSGRERTQGIVIGPYFSHQFTPWLSLDVQGGYAWQRQKMRRVDPAGILVGKRSSHGYQLSAALNAWQWVNSVAMLSGRLGVVATRDRWQAYDEVGGGASTPVPAVTQKLVQGVVEGGVSFWMEPLMPYMRVGYTRDVYRRNVKGTSDRDDFTLTGGMMWYGDGALDGLSLDMSSYAIVGRRQQRHWGVNLGLKWSW